MKRFTASLVCSIAALLACATAHAADVTVELLQMGVGSHVRPGDSTGLLVRLTSNLTEPVQTRVQWELRNADGDTALYARDIPLAPGAPTDRWLYGVLPIASSAAESSVEMVTVVRILQMDGEHVVRELAVARLNGGAAAETPTAVQVQMALIGVLGDGRVGLGPLAPGAGTNSGRSDDVPSMNEAAMVARGIEPSRLPDRWEGLASFSALVWGNAGTQNLGPEQARALLDWVRRGGNLVIVLPESGDVWGLLTGKGGRTPLAEVLPEGGVQRHDAVPVQNLMPLIARNRELRNPAARTSLWTFDVQATGRGYEPVLVMPCEVDLRTGNLAPEPGTLQGQTVAVRRAYGFGTIAVIGIDADGLDRRALNPDGLPQTDIFWNRFLGRRADAPSAREWSAIERDKRLLSSSEMAVAPADGGQLFGDAIGMRFAAAIGVLGLIAAFGAYWLIAGPGSYYALRSVRKVHYAWLGFVLVAGAATVITWLGTGVNRFTGGRVQHVTFLDRVVVPGAPSIDRALVRANTWFSAELPGYGPTRISMDKGTSSAGSDAVWTWFAPPDGRGESFPDTERYVIPVGHSADYSMPSRATSTVLWGQWMGEPSGGWEKLPSVAEGSALRQVLEWHNDTIPTVILQGVLVHQLPGPLNDVEIIHINPARYPARTQASADSLAILPSSALPNYGRISKKAEWLPGEPLDLSLALYGVKKDDAIVPRAERVNSAASSNSAGSLQASLERQYVTPVIENSVYGQAGVGRTLSAQGRFDMLNYFQMMPQPKYLRPKGEAEAPFRGYGAKAETARFGRDMARAVDLSMWFTRPCLMVIGTLRDRDPKSVGTPFPLEIGGRAPGVEGDTVVRVVFPLPEVPGLMCVPLEREEAPADKPPARPPAKPARPGTPAAPASDAPANDTHANDAPGTGALDQPTTRRE